MGEFESVRPAVEVPTPKAKKNTGLKIACAVLGVAVIGLVTFVALDKTGVLANKEDKPTACLDDNHDDLVDKNADSIEGDATISGILLGDTGLKIKYPENIVQLSYKLDQDPDVSITSARLTAEFTGYSSSLVRQNSLSFGKLDEWSLASVNIYTADEYARLKPVFDESEANGFEVGDVVFSDGKYVVIVIGAQNRYYSSGSEELEAEEKSSAAMLEWLSNKENYYY